tara:strand:- start:532 stop:717 length:186 start_codon:yes stop_codon:yes gene_type:complete
MIITIVNPDNLVIKFAIIGLSFINNPPKIIPIPAKISPQATKYANISERGTPLDAKKSMKP